MTRVDHCQIFQTIPLGVAVLMNVYVSSVLVERKQKLININCIWIFVQQIGLFDFQTKNYSFVFFFFFFLFGCLFGQVCFLSCPDFYQYPLLWRDFYLNPNLYLLFFAVYKSPSFWFQKVQNSITLTTMETRFCIMQLPEKICC